MFCKFCGEKISETDIYCPKCGHRFAMINGKRIIPIAFTVISGLLLIITAAFFASKAVPYYKDKSTSQMISETSTDSDAGENSQNQSTQPETSEDVTDESLGELLSDSIGFLINEDNSIEFSIELKDKVDSPIELFCNDESLGELKGNGNGIYTYSLSLRPTNKETYDFYVSSEGKKSNTVTVKVYDDLSEDDIEKSNKVFSQLNSVEDAYKIDGYVPYDKYPVVIDELCNKAEELSQEYGVGIERLSKDSCGITIRSDSGITYIYELDQEGVLAGGAEAELSVVNIESIYQGYVNDPSFVKKTQELKNRIPRITSSSSFSGKDVTLHNIQQAFVPNSIIIWLGHGYYNKDGLSFLLTGEDYSESVFKWKEYLINEKMALKIKKVPAVLVNYRFFSGLMIDLSNSFVYFNSCYSAKDGNLMGSMLRKNADVVIGYSDITRLVYATAIFNTVIDELCKPAKDGKGYETIFNALTTAKDIHGKEDDSWGSKPVLVGDAQYRISSFVKETSDLNQIGELYDQYIKTQFNTEYGPVRIAFCYIDDDDIPEALITQDGDISAHIVKIINDKAVLLKYCAYDGFYYKPNSNDILISGGDGESSESGKYKIAGDKLQFIDGVGRYWDYYETGIDEMSYYKVVDNGEYYERASAITEEEYNSFMKDFDNYTYISYENMKESVEEALESIQ